MACLGGSIFLLKMLQNVAHAQTGAAYLVGIGGANALTRGAHLVLALLSLVGGIEHAVGGHNEVRLLRNMQALLQRVSALLQRLGLVHEEVGSQHHTIAYNVHLVTLEDARRDAAQHIFLPLKLQCVPGIGASLESGYNIIAGSEHVNYLSLAFVAPLQTQQDVNLSFVHHSCYYLLLFYVCGFFG